MKKYNVYIGCKYVEGYLKYGHFEGIVEASSEEKAKAIALAKPYRLNFVIDDYDVNVYMIDKNDTEVSEAGEGNHE